MIPDPPLGFVPPGEPMPPVHFLHGTLVDPQGGQVTKFRVRCPVCRGDMWLPRGKVFECWPSACSTAEQGGEFPTWVVTKAPA